MNRDTLLQILMPNRAFFPASDGIHMDMKKRDCSHTAGVCLGD